MSIRSEIKEIGARASSALRNAGKMPAFLRVGCILALMFFVALLSAAAQSPEAEDRPANFVFLVDVSGSMVSNKTMVTSQDGAKITLFEALRDALKGILSDERLIGPKSKIAFITFGTAITDKSDWPQSLSEPSARQELIRKISSSEDLQADKHGDTYMGGALNQAYAKAEEFAKSSEPCTQTFIVMLTDGWDEPPAGAPHKVRAVAQRIVEKQQTLKKKLGVNTWQVRVVGLQRLPDTQKGTTTASEVAKLLGGEFIDVNKQSSGTVAQRIYGALKKTLADLRGQVEVAPLTQGGLVDFGVIESANQSESSVRVVSKSCYAEEIKGIEQDANSLTADVVQNLRATFTAFKGKGALKDASSFESITPLTGDQNRFVHVRPKQQPFGLLPMIEQVNQGTTWQQYGVVASVDHTCPPGIYLGALRLISTARVKQAVPFVISVPARFVTDQEVIKATVRKPGFFWAEPTSTVLSFNVGAQVGRASAVQDEVIIKADSGKSDANAILDKALINDGKPVIVRLDTSKEKAKQVQMNVSVPANQPPGTYTGILQVSLVNPSNAVAPADMKYIVELLPSPWEQVRPIAIPIFLVLALSAFIGVVILLSRLKREP